MAKTKKCKLCGVRYERLDSHPAFQNWCSVGCAFELARLKQRKAADKAKAKKLRDDKARIKTRGDWLKEAQAAFNAFIRKRDEAEPCISCQRHHQGQYHAGHYRTVGAHPELRFNELNCHKQCSACNNYKSGNIVEYRINLAKKISQKQLDWLEGEHPPANYSIEDIKNIKEKYKNMLKM